MPAVRPLSVQVGATATSTASVWPSASITSCATRTSLHLEQCWPSVRPDVVQVGAIASSTTGMWLHLSGLFPSGPQMLTGGISSKRISHDASVSRISAVRDAKTSNLRIFFIFHPPENEYVISEYSLYRGYPTITSIPLFFYFVKGFLDIFQIFLINGAHPINYMMYKVTKNRKKERFPIINFY